MATQGDYLVNQSVDDAKALLRALEQAGTLTTRVVQPMAALGTAAAETYDWQPGYAQSDFVALYNKLVAQRPLIIDDATRDALLKLVSSIQ